jgi:hypothetical protein
LRSPWYALVSALLCLALCACATRAGQAPDAAKRPTEERYGTDRTIVGKGCVAVTEEVSTDRLEADQAARAEVAKQLEVKVIQVVEDMQREEQMDGKRTHVYAMSIQTREFVDKTLKGIRIEARTRDEEKGIQCSVAVLDKSAMAFQLRKEVERNLRERSEHVAGAESALGTENRADALREYSLAMVSTDRAAVAAKMILELGYSPPMVPSRAETGRKRAEVLEGIRLLRAGGEAQRGRPGRPLAEPLRVEAVGPSGRPVANLPLRAQRAPEGCHIQAEGRTDMGGKAEMWVYRVVSNRTALEEIAIGIDWERLLALRVEPGEGAPLWENWDAREVVFTYRIPVPGDYRVGVAIFESGTGRPLHASPIQSRVLEGLQQAGFKTRDLLAGSSLQERPSPEQARKLFDGKVDFLVVGDVSLRFSSETSGLTFFRARGILEGIAPGTGRTVATLDLEAKGGGLDHDRAARKALDNLAERLRTEIGPALEGALE